MRKYLASLLTIGSLTSVFFAPYYIDGYITRYTERNQDQTFVNPFRVHGIGYPYNASHCVIEDKDDYRECHGYRAQQKFATTFRR